MEEWKGEGRGWRRGRGRLGEEGEWKSERAGCWGRGRREISGDTVGRRAQGEVARERGMGEAEGEVEAEAWEYRKNHRWNSPRLLSRSRRAIHSPFTRYCRYCFFSIFYVYNSFSFLLLLLLHFILPYFVHVFSSFLSPYESFRCFYLRLCLLIEEENLESTFYLLTIYMRIHYLNLVNFTYLFFAPFSDALQQSRSNAIEN